MATLIIGATAAPNVMEHITVDAYSVEEDYLKEMRQCAEDGGEYAMQMGAIYERQRNLKIDEEGINILKTNYFDTYDTGADIINAMKVDKMKSEYAVAGRVYEYLHAYGYPDTVIAGILGNMMAECGGQTLELQWNIYGGGGSYYGLCQWSLRLCSPVGGKTVTEQLDYLTGTVSTNMKQFGGSHTYFCEIKDAGEAARYFCTFYERGAGAYQRAKNAYVALDWISKA